MKQSEANPNSDAAAKRNVKKTAKGLGMDLDSLIDQIIGDAEPAILLNDKGSSRASGTFEQSGIERFELFFHGGRQYTVEMKHP